MESNPYTLLRSAFVALEKVASDTGNTDLASRANYYGKRVAPRAFSIAFVGEFKAGKSTLVNAMVGQGVLPTATRECTGVVTHVRALRQGESAGVTVTLEDGTSHQAALDDVESALSIKGGTIFRRKRVHEAEIRLKEWRWADFDVVFVDTPGVNAGPKVRDESVLKYLPSADAIVFVTRADQLLNASEREFISQYVVRDDLAKLFVVINRADELSFDAERLSIQNKAREILRSLMPSEPRVYLTSAADYLDGKEDGDGKLVDGSGVPDMEEALRIFLRDERIEAELKTSRNTLAGLVRELERGLKRAETNASIGIDRIRDRAKRFDRAIDHVRSDGSKLSSEANAILERELTSHARDLISTSMSALQSKLQEQADREGVTKKELVSAAQDGLRATGVKLESLIRERGRNVQTTLATRLKATFDDAEVEIEQGEPASHALISVEAANLESMISMQSVKIESEREVVDRGETLVNAGVGALIVGGLAALLFPPAGVAIAAAIGARMGSEQGTKIVKDVRTKMKAKGIPEVVAAAKSQLNTHLDQAAGQIASQLSGVVDRMVSAKLAELEHQRSQLADRDPAELENKRREASEQLGRIAALKQQHLPEMA